MRLSYHDVVDLKITAEAGYLAKMRRRFTDMTRLYDRELDLRVSLPEDMPRHIPSTAPSTVDTFAAQVRTTDPRVTLGSVGLASRDQEKNSQRTSFGQYVLALIDEYEDEPLWEYLRFDLALLGAACVRIGVNYEAWSDNQEEQPSLWPFIFKAVPPGHVVIPPGFRWPYPFVIETQRRTYAELSQQYPDFRPTERYIRDTLHNARIIPTTAVDVHFYWDNDDYVVVAGGQELYHSKNALGIPPYVWGFSRLGHKSEDADPDDQAVGILRHAESELRAEAELKTYADTVWRHTAIPTIIGTVPSEQVRSAMSAKWGRYVHLQQGKQDAIFEFMEPPMPNQAMWALLGELEQNIERATLAEVLSGDAGGSRAASQYGFQVGQARLKTSTVRQSLERIAGRLLAITARYYTKVLASSVQTENKLVPVSALENYEDYRVSFEAVEPKENAQRHQDGLALWQSNAMPWSHIAKNYWDIEDPGTIWNQMLAENMIRQVVQSGLAAQMLLSEALADGPLIGSAGGGIQQAAQGLAQDVTTQTSEGVLGAPSGAPRGAPFGRRLGPSGARSGQTTVDAV